MTLTETAQLTKKILAVSAMSFVVIIILWASVSYYLNSRPKPEIKILPDKNFGILPKPPLPKSKLTSTNLTYNLDTETGNLPTDFPELLKVYFIPKLGTTFLAPDKAKKLAASFDFKNGPQILSPTIHRFTDDIGGEFIFDLDTTNFRFKRPIATDSANRSDSPLPEIESEAKLIDNFKRFLAERNVLPSNLYYGAAKVFYDKPKLADSTEAAVTLWESDIVEIAAEGKEENAIKYPIVTPEFKEGLIRGVVTKYQTHQNKYISLDYIYWPVDPKNFATYPALPIDQAYEKLQNGEGVTALPFAGSSVSIEKVYIAYLLPKEYTPYLQPVYVFEGPNFAAYVPAIKPDNFEP